ncbi:hypothetical protein GIB67_023133 [Kingdonia uniflora]|uniref:CCHC-type domain-containing protein n=1 Tax=Kingdonia uniflora TaxID=39325 RepID=A0A7J7M5X9_9MAGN|nr:hypothetical protein GIB67_023133 [Kingdonia uniflora]
MAKRAETKFKTVIPATTLVLAALTLTTTTETRPMGNSSGVQCFGCGKTSHMRRDCPNAKKHVVLLTEKFRGHVADIVQQMWDEEDEVGHYLAAFPKKVKLGIPYFIPNITLGSFGAITQFKSILPDRRTKVDISLAGPFAGAALSFSMFSVGLLLSLKPYAAGDLVQVPSMLFQGSLLLGLISRATLGYTCGLTTSAFNMLPVGCLDGGRAVQGAFGGNALFGFSLTTYTLLGLGMLGGPLSLPWGLYVLICQRTPEKPCLDDVSEVGTWRRTSLIIGVFMVLLTLLPLWDELAEELGIGLVTTF